MAEKMTNKELGIIGDAYQRSYDSRREFLTPVGLTGFKNEMKSITIADVWVHFPKVERLEVKPTVEQFELLYRMASDIIKMTDIAYSVEDDRKLLNMMRLNGELHQKIDLERFGRDCWLSSRESIRTFCRKVLGTRISEFEEKINDFNNGYGDVDADCYSMSIQDRWYKPLYPYEAKKPSDVLL